MATLHTSIASSERPAARMAASAEPLAHRFSESNLPVQVRMPAALASKVLLRRHEADLGVLGDELHSGNLRCSQNSRLKMTARYGTARASCFCPSAAIMFTGSFM